MSAFSYSLQALLGPGYAGLTLKCVLLDADGNVVAFEDSDTSKTNASSGMTITEVGSDGHYLIECDQWPAGSLPFWLELRDNSDDSKIPDGLCAFNEQDLALSAAQVNAEVDTALADYDGPTKAELDAAQAAIEAAISALNDLSAAQVNAEVDTALADYDGPTKAELDAGLALIQAKTDLIGSGAVVVVTPVATGGAATVYCGDDYADGDDRALAWSSDSWPDLTSATVMLYLRAPTGATFSKAGSVASAGGDTQIVEVELTAAESTTLVAWPSASELRVRATLASGTIATLVDATLTAIEDIS